MAVFVGRKIKHYFVKDKLSFGGSSRVFRVIEDVSNKFFAMKVIDLKDEKKQKTLEAEVRVGVRIGRLSPFLVRSEDVEIVNDECCLIMDYFAEGDLSQLIRKRKDQSLYFSEEESVRYLYEICCGLKVLHDNGVLHRDLKPQNIFVGENKTMKIGDFGISRTNSALSTVAAGTMGYSCLEILNGSTKPTKEMDLFALGCIFVEMIDLSHPFSNAEGSIVLGNIFAGTINPPSQAEMSSSVKTLRDIGCSLMSRDPKARPSVDQVLSHPVFQLFLAKEYVRLVSLRGDAKPAQGEPKQEIGKEGEIEEQVMACRYISSRENEYVLDGMDLTFSGVPVVFLDYVMTTGIFKLTLTCIPYIMLGVGKFDPNIRNMEIQFGNSNCFYNSSGGVYFHPKNGASQTQIVVMEGAPISLEINMEARTLHFLYGAVHPQYLVSTPSPAQFGVSHGGGSAFGRKIKFVSLVKLLKPTVDSNARRTPIAW